MSDKINNENLASQEKKSMWQKIKDFVVPMANEEEKKLGYLLGIMFTANIYIYTVSRLLKDNLVIAELSGEAVPFMKMIVAIASLIFGVIYVLGISIFNRRNLFNITLTIFIAFFAIFGFIIYPFKEHFVLSDSSILSINSWLSGNTGEFFILSKFIKMILTGGGLGVFFSLTNFNIKNLLKNIVKYILIIISGYSLLYYFSGPALEKNLHLPVAILKIWPSALYYIISEMWGSYALALLFWNFSNYQFNLSEAKRIYPFIGLVGQFGQIGAGLMTKLAVKSPYFVSIVSASTIISGLVILFLHEYIFRTSGRESENTVIKQKKKPSFNDSIKAMMSSPIILLTSSIILIYGMLCNILETYWKINLTTLANKLYPTSKAMAKEYFSSNQSTMVIFVGVVSFIAALIGGYLIRKMGWRFSALITPITVAIGGISFFGITIFNILMGTEKNIAFLLTLAMMIGTIVLVFVKATKYTLFDNTKEMLLMTLPSELKSQSKVADSLSGKFGKTLGGASLSLIGLIGGAISGLPFLVIIFFLMIVFSLLWISIVFKLSVIEQSAEEEEVKTHK